jgi:hypothetical protein
VAHNYAIDDDRVPGGHTGMAHPDLVPHWHRYDSRHRCADACDLEPECIGYTCNVRPPPVSHLPSRIDQAGGSVRRRPVYLVSTPAQPPRRLC